MEKNLVFLMLLFTFTHLRISVTDRLSFCTKIYGPWVFSVLSNRTSSNFRPLVSDDPYICGSSVLDIIERRMRTYTLVLIPSILTSYDESDFTFPLLKIFLVIRTKFIKLVSSPPSPLRRRS